MADVLLFPTLPFEDEPELSDAAARRQALDIRQSMVVEAPAGSGKTGLLIQRYLKLLTDPQVTLPEQVLAITFTRKATGEMRDRVLSHLQAAQRDDPVGGSEFEQETRILARAVLARDRELGWSLVSEPARLRIRTIDSLCAEIARMLPVLSGSGGRLRPVEQAAPLYREAARRTLLQLGGPDVALHAALREVLLHRDGNLANCEALVADMLSVRDQWGELIWGMQGSAQGAGRRQPLDDAYLDAHVLPRLEAALDRALCAALAEVQLAFPPDLLEEAAQTAAELMKYDGGLDRRLAPCRHASAPPQPCSADLEYWKALAHLLIPPSSNTWRRNLNATTYGGQIAPETKTRLQGLLSRLEDRDELRALLCEIRELPPACYPEDQWRVAKALFRVLSHALVELQVVFAEREECDFTELSLLARHALSQSTGAEDLAEAAGSRLQHLLVDEMQDTSASQYHLLETLTRSWDGHSQTVFLVGDPRQSIYLFRHARVERFLQVIREQRLGDLPLQHVRLSANFRSQAHLVEGFNEHFAAMFPHYSDPLPYSDAEAVLPPSEDSGALKWHAHIIPTAAKTTTTPAELQQRQRRSDAEEVVGIVRQWLARPLPAGRRQVRSGSGAAVPEPWRIAVLVRSRSHLIEIAAALDDARISKRAVNIEPLNERQEILDLTALTRLVLHPADRVAGLAALRAPWCGLPLADLLLLTGQDNPELRDISIPRLLDDRGALLPEDSRRRAQRLQSVLELAAEQRGRAPVAQLVERAWRSLGGDALLDESALANGDRLFQLLAELEDDSQEGGVNLNLLEARLRGLYAEDRIFAPEVAHVDLLTIHGAKGLEWDVVIVPSLERAPDPGKRRLLAWTTLDDEEADGANVILAPIAAHGNDPEPLTKWLGRIDRKRELEEHKRLFYVACTRARRELHLFAAPKESAEGELQRRPGTLLHAAWPAGRQYFAQPALPAFRRAVEQEDEPLQIAAAAGVERARREVPALKRISWGCDPRARFAEARKSRLPYGTAERSAQGPEISVEAKQLFARPEGSYAARAFGNLIHGSLDLLARQVAAGASLNEMRGELSGWLPRLGAALRSEGLPPGSVDRVAKEAIYTLQGVLSDPEGAWILSPHPRSASELALTSGAAASPDGMTSIRADRIFFAGAEPRSPGDDFLWIVDYKTAAHGKGGLDAFLARQREVYTAQLEKYAQLLAPALGADMQRVRVALYFPALPRLLWWDPMDPN